MGNLYLCVASRGCSNGALRRKEAGEGPTVPKLEENNARQGFFERADFESVVKHLPRDLQDFADAMVKTQQYVQTLPTEKESELSEATPSQEAM